jgi:hypothetical protein
VVREPGHCDNVAQWDLVSTRQVPLQTGRLKIAALPEAATLVQELLPCQIDLPLQDYNTYGAWRRRATMT